VEVADGWTVAAVVAHLAFWDRMVLSRWDDARKRGLATPPDLPDSLEDILNASLLPEWRTMSPFMALAMSAEAAQVVDDAVRRLGDDAIVAVLAQGRPRLVDRSLHRAEHAAMIEAVIKGPRNSTEGAN